MMLALGVVSVIGSALILQAPQGNFVVQGVVQDQRGSPLVGAEVVVTQVAVRVLTNAKGEFRIERLPVGSYSLIARYPGYSAASRAVQVPDSSRERMVISLTSSPYLLEDLNVIARRRGLFGVVGDHSLRPRPGARVTVRGRTRSSTLTDSSGRFDFVELEPGAHVVTVSLDGFGTRQFLVTIPGNGMKEVGVLLGVDSDDSPMAKKLEVALVDLSRRIALNSDVHPSHMTQEELRQYEGSKLCDIPKLRVAIRAELVGPVRIFVCGPADYPVVVKRSG